MTNKETKMNERPPYVVLGNLFVLLGAAQLSDVVMHNFCVEADRAKLQAWLDKAFSEPSNGAVRYEAVGDRLFLSFVETGQARGAGRDDGYYGEIETIVWLLARRLDDGLLALRWIPVYLFVDSGTAQASGREVWGFPKQIGRAQFTAQGPHPSAPRAFAVDALVMKAFSQDSKATYSTIFEARPLVGQTGDPPGGLLGSLKSLAETAVSRLTGAFTSISVQLHKAFGEGEMVMVFLKQFPDAADPTRACYQGIIEAQAKVNGFRGAGLTDTPYEVRITSYASHPFLAELGLKEGWQGVGQGVWVDFDFEQHLGAEVWRAG
jgi:hypothetical protein